MTHPWLEENTVLGDLLTEDSVSSLVRLAAAALEVHAVRIRLVTPDGQVQHSMGQPEAWLRRSGAAIAALEDHVTRTGEAVIADDLRGSELVGGLPAAEGAGIVACTSLPLVLEDGTPVGSFCALDPQPHPWTDDELEVIRGIAASATREIQLRVTLVDKRRTEAGFRALVENATEVITVLDREGVILYESPSITDILGYTPEELVGRSAFSFVHPDDLPRVLATFREGLETPGRTLSLQFRFRHQDGEWRTLESTGTNGLEDPAVRGVAVSSRDVTARYAVEEQLRVQKAYFERLFESAPEGIVLLDPDDRVLHVNPEFTRIFGYSAAEAVGQPINVLIAPESRREESRDITRRVASGESIRVETIRLHQDGTPVEVSILGNSIELGSDRIGVFGIYRDITERKKTEAQLAAHAEELRALSLTDELTGLSNRRGFFALADHEVSLARREGKTLVLLFLDVDDMKEINDEFGHAVGDQALVDAAGVLKDTFRDSDVMARMGGDEFAVLAWIERGDPIRPLLERLQENLDGHNISQPRPYRLSMSVGAAAGDPASPTPLDDLLRQADTAMYEAKRSN